MNRLADKIVVEPLSNERVNRVEADILAGFRAESVAPARASRRWWWMVPATAVAAAGALALFVLLRPNLDRTGVASPTRVVTPAGEGATLSVGDSTIAVDGATAAEIFHDETTGAVEVMLYVGRVECEVPHVPNRPSFAVIAGDVHVRVVGTQFAVERGDDVTVTVTRGEVSVTSGDGATAVAAGESWTGAIAAAARIPQWAVAAREARATLAAATLTPPPATTPAPAPTPAPALTPTPAPTPEPRRAVKRRPTPEREAATAIPRPTPGRIPSDEWRDVRDLEKDDVDAAIKAYQNALKGPDGKYAAYRLAYVQYFVNKDARKAIRFAEYVEKRFPDTHYGKHAQWLRIYILYHQGKKAEVRAAARSYLKSQPWPYREAAAKLVDWY